MTRMVGKVSKVMTKKEVIKYIEKTRPETKDIECQTIPITINEKAEFMEKST